LRLCGPTLIVVPHLPTRLVACRSGWGRSLKRGFVDKNDLQSLKRALVDAGVEIYRTRPDEIHVAERVRLHIMDSGVKITFGDDARVMFSARSQRSDFPHDSATDLFDKVRDTVGRAAKERGYIESDAITVEVKDPVDNDKILDVWHEVTYARPVDDLATAVDEVKWSLALEKYISG
jgi:hypothetical protein